MELGLECPFTLNKKCYLINGRILNVEIVTFNDSNTEYYVDLDLLPLKKEDEGLKYRWDDASSTIFFQGPQKTTQNFRPLNNKEVDIDCNWR